jgi:hypothetical protein
VSRVDKWSWDSSSLFNYDEMRVWVWFRDRFWIVQKKIDFFQEENECFVIFLTFETNEIVNVYFADIHNENRTILSRSASFDEDVIRKRASILNFRKISLFNCFFNATDFLEYEWVKVVRRDFDRFKKERVKIARRDFDCIKKWIKIARRDFDLREILYLDSRKWINRVIVK